jgi:hypothetical protein
MNRDEVVKKRLAEVAEDGPLYSAIFVKAYAGEGSKRDAIKAMCLHCVGLDEGHREAIKNCTGYSCPLWQWRPYLPRAGKGSKNDAPAEDGGLGA